MAIRTLLREGRLAIARTGTAMKPNQIGNRVVVIGPSPPAAEKVAYREPTHRRATSQRVVVIKNGELVGGSPGR
jgi:hypothetical protein